jgi:hypothetical protein
MTRLTKRWLGGIGTLATSVGLIGVLHMPFARSFLMDLGGCPVGHASLAQLEPARNAAIATEKGAVAAQAPMRPALGFALGKTTRADTEAWADRSHVSCDGVREGLVLCKDVPSSALGLPASDGKVGELHFGFDTHGLLVDVSTMRMHAEATPAADIEKRLEAQVGAPQQRTGSFDGPHLAANGALSSVRYRYRDYFAEVIAMRFKGDGLVVREHYMSAND